MNEKILDSEKRRVIRLQSGVVQQQQFFLAGGTGLGLHLGHRVSKDLDWFTPHPFDATQLAETVAKLKQKPSEVKVQGAHTLRVYYGQLETSFIQYAQVIARPQLLTVGSLEVPVADMDTLALMKAAAVHDRGARRDFADIHAICALPGWSVARFIDLATSRLPLAPVQMKLALTYFSDADKRAASLSYKVPWERVKSELQRGVQDWERSRSRGLGG